MTPVPPVVAGGQPRGPASLPQVVAGVAIQLAGGLDVGFETSDRLELVFESNPLGGCEFLDRSDRGDCFFVDIDIDIDHIADTDTFGCGGPIPDRRP